MEWFFMCLIFELRNIAAYLPRASMQLTRAVLKAHSDTKSTLLVLPSYPVFLDSFILEIWRAHIS